MLFSENALLESKLFADTNPPADKTQEFNGRFKS
jgi:hypothetical protein